MFLASCGGGSSNQGADDKTNENTQMSEQKAEPEQTPLEKQLALGEKIYKEKCIVCHQADAKGIEHAFPPLAGSDYLLEDPVRGIHQTLNGSNEEMVVNGKTYNAPMAPQVKTKEEAVAVINYVLKEFNGYTDDQLLTMKDAEDVEIDPLPIAPQAPQQQ